MSSFYLDGIYAFWESKRGEETKEVVVPEAAHWRSVQQRAEAQRYKEEQVEKAKRVALKAQNAAERAERHRLRGESNLSSFSLRSLPSSINRFRSRVWSGQKTLGQMKEAPSRERSPANLQGLAAADVQEAKSGDHHRVTRAHSTPAPAPAAAADAGPSRPSTGRKNSPKPIGTRTITHGRYDSGHHEACQGTNFGEGRMGLVVKKKASMASSRSKYSQPESAEVVGQRKREQDGEGIEGMERF
ncbi:MAG: hypothetical protein LQ352_007151 [Teloschistes flavicans]|nr:MAG: hypothetical protein LQ352_007151 [Teloschistes flavicans]